MKILHIKDDVRTSIVILPSAYTAFGRNP